jgi:hypothetical protein
VIVVTYGLRRSGAQMVCRLTRTLLELAGCPQSRLPAGLVAKPDVLRDDDLNVVHRWGDDRLRKLLDATRGSRIAIRTSAGPDGLTTGALFRALETGELKVHLVYRDPREIVSSYATAPSGEKLPAADLDKGIRELRADLGKLRHWGTFPSLKLCLDDFAEDPADLVGRMSEDLGVVVDPHRVVERTSEADDKQLNWRARWRDRLTTDDAARVESAVPNYLRMVETRDHAWFGRIG